MTIKNLIELLAKQGIKETPSSISNKFLRGTFTASFFLACLKAMNIKQLSLEDDVFSVFKKTDAIEALE